MSSENEKLLDELFKAQKAEAKAKEKRIQLEAEIEKLYQFEGKSKTFNEEKFKVTIKKSVTVSLDQEKYIAARPNIPEELRPEKIKFDLDSKGFEWLKENNQEIYKMVSDCVTEKDGKTSVKVEKK